MLPGLGSVGRGSGKVAKDLVLEIDQPLRGAGKIFVVEVIFRVHLAGDALVSVLICSHHLLNGFIGELIGVTTYGLRDRAEYVLVMSRWMGTLKARRGSESNSTAVVDSTRSLRDRIMVVFLLPWVRLADVAARERRYV
jgi:hypothetical protein